MLLCHNSVKRLVNGKLTVNSHRLSLPFRECAVDECSSEHIQARRSKLLMNEEALLDILRVICVLSQLSTCLCPSTLTLVGHQGTRQSLALALDGDFNPRNPVEDCHVAQEVLQPWDRRIPGKPWDLLNHGPLVIIVIIIT